MFAEAGAKYQAALAIKPDFEDAVNNWGGALLVQAHTKRGDERQQWLDLAVGKLSEGLRQGWKKILYNLGLCLCPAG